MRCIVATITVLFGAIAVAAEPSKSDPQTTFYSDKVLRNALADIGQMPEAELRAFTHYLAECQSNSLDASNMHPCAAAQTAYEIEYRNNRALDDLIIARSTLSALSPDAQGKNVMQLADAAAKYAKIISALEDAAHDRFRSLKASQK